jgi:capsular exopolysaccharide synthesis family protein
MVMSNEPLQTPDGAGGPSSADAVHAAMRFLRVVQRRKLELVSCLVVSSLLGALYYFTAPRIYEAIAGLRIKPNEGIGGLKGNTVDPNSDVRIQTEIEIIKSHEVATAAIKELESVESKAASERTPAKRLLGRLVDFEGLPRPMWEDKLRRMLGVRHIRRTTCVEMSYRSKSAFSAGAVLDAIITAYNNYVDRSNQCERKRNVDDVTKELRGVESQLKDKEKERKDLIDRIQYMGRDENGTDVATQHHLQTKLKDHADAEKTVNVREGDLRDVDDGIRRGDDFRRDPSIVERILGPDEMKHLLGRDPSSAETRARHERQWFEDRAALTDLLRTRGEGNSEVGRLQGSIRQLENYLRDPLATLDPVWLRKRLLETARNKLQNAKDNKRRAFDELETAKRRAQEKSRELEKLGEIDREISRLDRDQESLLDERKKYVANMDRPPIIVEVPNPVTASNRPVSPRLSMVGMLCLIAGLGIGMALIYVQDVLDDRFRSPEELQEQLGAPLLAIIRRLYVEAVSGLGALQMYVAPNSEESEGFRTLRTSLALSGRDTERIAITSAEASVGKTTMVANLGVACADAGKRTLLIDCDLRRPGLTRLFELRAHSGLSDILRRSEEIAAMCQSCVLPTGVKDLDVLPSGPKPSNPAELLVGPRLSDVLAWAESNYDQVIVDCPPILAAADAAIVGRLTGGLILVVQPEMNHRRPVIRAVGGLAAMGVGLVGVVANRVEEKNGEYYDSGYGAACGTGAEEPAETEPEEREAEAAGADDAEDADPERHVKPLRRDSRTIVPRRAA